MAALWLLLWLVSLASARYYNDDYSPAKQKQLVASANMGDVEAAFEVGVNKMYGTNGVAVDRKRAVRFLRAAADTGHVCSMTHLALAYKWGHGAEKNIKESERILSRCIELGDTCGIGGFCSEMLMLMYKDGLVDETNRMRAIRLFRMAAEQGHKGALDDLLAVTKQLSDEAKIEHVEFAASLNHPSAIDQLYEFSMHRKVGSSGLKKNLTDAVRLFRVAANKGHAGAQYELGLCNRFGFGVPQNLLLAVQLFQQAADADHRKARFELSECYRHGVGVQKDVRAADFHLELSRGSDKRNEL